MKAYILENMDKISRFDPRPENWAKKILTACLAAGKLKGFISADKKTYYIPWPQNQVNWEKYE